MYSIKFLYITGTTDLRSISLKAQSPLLVRGTVAFSLFESVSCYICSKQKHIKKKIRIRTLLNQYITL